MADNNIGNITPKDFAVGMHLLKQADTNGIAGLQDEEIVVFKSSAEKAGLSEESVNAMLGLHFSETTGVSKTGSADGTQSASQAKAPAKVLFDEGFIRAMAYFAENGGFNSEQRGNIADFAETVGITDFSLKIEKFDEIESASEYLKKHPELLTPNFKDLLQELVQILGDSDVQRQNIIDIINKINDQIQKGTIQKNIEELINELNEIQSSVNDEKLESLIKEIQQQDGASDIKAPEQLTIEKLMEAVPKNQKISIDLDAIVNTASADQDDINNYLEHSLQIANDYFNPMPQTFVDIDSIAEANFGMSLEEFKSQNEALLNAIKTDVIGYLQNLTPGELESVKPKIVQVINFKNAVETAVYEQAQEAVQIVGDEKSELTQDVLQDLVKLETFRQETNPTENMVPSLKFSGTRQGYQQAVKMEYAKVTNPDTSSVDEVDSTAQNKEIDGRKYTKTLLNGSNVLVIKNGNVYTSIDGKQTYTRDAFQ